MLTNNILKNIRSSLVKESFCNISFDSSKCKKNAIFFAIKGSKFDGNNYIDHAIKNGARTIISENIIQKKNKKVLYIKVKNTRKLLSEFASKLYSKKPNYLVAVTGTNGKTSIADYFCQILENNNKKACSIGTLGFKLKNRFIKTNNTTLDPILFNKFLQKAKKKNIENAIVEASSHGLHQNRLDGIKFNCGIFTNLSHDHLDYHKTIKKYLNAKLYLFKNLLNYKSKIICDNNFIYIDELRKISKNKKLKLITVGESKTSDLRILSHSYKNNFQFLDFSYKKKFFKVKIPLIGKIQIYNLLMAILAVESKKLPMKKILKKIHLIKPVKARLEIIGKINNGAQIILDYAHTPEALKCTLESISGQYKRKKLVLVFGCGGNRDKNKRAIMGKIAGDYCEKIYITDDNPRFENPKLIRKMIKKNIPKKKIFEVSNRSKAIQIATNNLNSDEVLIIAGKGHEEIQDYGNTKIKISDREEIKRSIKLKNLIKSRDLKVNILEELCKKKIKLVKKINSAWINSKDVRKNDIFLALKGKKIHGNNYAKKAIKNGASLVISNKKNSEVNKNKELIVKDPIKFLENAAKKIRICSDAKIIAVTGSCGKTSLKNMLVGSLKFFGKTSYSEKSFNNYIGVPLSLFNLNLNAKFGVFEAGMDKMGEINNLTGLIKPDIGVITNISYAHSRNFKSLNGIAKAKSEIIYNINTGGLIILNRDDKYFFYHRNIASKLNLRIVSFGKKKSSDICLKKIIRKDNYYQIHIKAKSKNIIIKTNYIFESFIKNILATIAVISELGLLSKIHINFFEKFSIPSGRGDMNTITINKKKFLFIDETYNANPLSVITAIKNFNLMKTKSGRKILVLGDMLELGKFSKNLHENIAKEINKSKIDLIHMIGKNVKYTYNNTIKRKRGIFFKNKNEIFSFIDNDIKKNDTVMIKGSNATGLYKIANFLKRESNVI